MTDEAHPTDDRRRLDAWWREYELLDLSPWPGPRPLRGPGDERDVLVGRERDTQVFCDEVTKYRMVLLTGMTGVGKTSLLEAGLVPQLRRRGHQVAVCRDWSGSAVKANPVEFVAGKVREEYARQGMDDLPTGASLFWWLNNELRNQCVIVLDQFEELIRDAPALAEQLYVLLAEVNTRTELRVVISFRNEYLHELADLERGVNPYHLSHYPLKPVDPAYARAIVVAANRPDRLRVTDDAADLIAELWNRAREETRTEQDGQRDVRIGLLHLQALLYVLAPKTLDRVVERDDVESLAGDRTPKALFVHSLERAVQVKVDRCRTAAEQPDVGLDTYFVEGTIGMVAQAVPHLSSAGYKLIRNVHDLARVTLRDRYDTLVDAMKRSDDGPLAQGAFEAALDALLALTRPDGIEDLDLLSAGTGDVASDADALYDETKMPWRYRIDATRVPSALVDPARASCGPLLGSPPATVMIEELRRFVFALEWLRASDLVRISTPGIGGAMVALIHDGFGTALERWARRASTGPAPELAAITASRGGSFDWQTSEPRAELTGDESPRLLVNLRWRGAWVHADFRNVVFVNCDLSGTSFERCLFDGVAFVNCLLDGAVFTDCVVRGHPDQFDERWFLQPPEFVLDAPRSVLDALAHYRSEQADGNHRLLSQRSGLPAVPVESVSDDVIELSDPPRGLMIFGGRISAVGFRSTVFQGGRISVRHVAGSGLDVVEQSGGAFEIAGSALRHVTFSGPVEAANGSAATAAGEESFDITVVGSSISQLWIGAGLTGKFRANDCMLVQVWNTSPELAGRVSESTYYGLVGVSVEDSGALGHESRTPKIDEVITTADVLTRLVRMDYRGDPTQPFTETTLEALHTGR
jgi:hypothetical protein